MDKTQERPRLLEVLGGPEGSPVIGEIIDSLRPCLCVVAGRTWRRGIQRIASTLVVNPGSVPDDSAAWLDWGRPSAEQVELVSLRGLASAPAACSARPGGEARAGRLGPELGDSPVSLSFLKLLAQTADRFRPVVPDRPVRKEEIRQRAYLLWEAAGRPAGDSSTFWYRAEKELAGRRHDRND